MTTQQPKHSRKRVTSADYARAAAFLRSVNATVAAVDLAPGRARIITADGRAIGLGDTDAPDTVNPWDENP